MLLIESPRHCGCPVECVLNARISTTREQNLYYFGVAPLCGLKQSSRAIAEPRIYIGALVQQCGHRSRIALPRCCPKLIIQLLFGVLRWGSGLTIRSRREDWTARCDRRH